MAAGCSCAIATDEYHGYECEISGGACMFLIPNAKRCAEMYDEGPYVDQLKKSEEEAEHQEMVDDIILNEEGDFESEGDEIERIADGY